MQQSSWQAMAGTYFPQLSSGRRRHPCSLGNGLCSLAKAGLSAPSPTPQCAGGGGSPGYGMRHAMGCWCCSCASDQRQALALCEFLLEQQYQCISSAKA